MKILSTILAIMVLSVSLMAKGPTISVGLYNSYIEETNLLTKESAVTSYGFGVFVPVANKFEIGLSYLKTQDIGRKTYDLLKASRCASTDDAGEASYDEAEGTSNDGSTVTEVPPSQASKSQSLSSSYGDVERLMLEGRWTIDSYTAFDTSADIYVSGLVGLSLSDGIYRDDTFTGFGFGWNAITKYSVGLNFDVKALTDISKPKDFEYLYGANIVYQF